MITKKINRRCLGDQEVCREYAALTPKSFYQCDTKSIFHSIVKLCFTLLFYLHRTDFMYFFSNMFLDE